MKTPTKAHKFISELHKEHPNYNVHDLVSSCRMAKQQDGLTDTQVYNIAYDILGIFVAPCYK